MPSTYTLNNGIELIGTGEQSGTWGDTTNTNLELLDTALDGQVSITLAATGSSGSPNTLPISDGASSNGRNRLVIFGDGGDLGGTAFVQLTPNDAEKIIYVRNNLSGSRSILLFQGTYNASNDYEVPAGTTAVVFFNGAGTGAVAANVFNNAFFDSLRLGSVSVTAILDEDNMASDSATALATQQSIKAYVDTQVGANNELSEVLANGNTTGGTDISVNGTDDIVFGDDNKAIFGAGSDLRIYSDGTDSFIEEQTEGGSLYIDATDLQLRSTANAKYFRGIAGGAVDLYHDNAAKLSTSATGVDITGTAVTDGLTVAGNVSVDGGTIKLDGNYPVGTGNVALGNTAFDAVTSGIQNTAIGANSMTANTSGTNNTAVGRSSLAANISGVELTAVGTNALSLNTGSYNTAIGSAALVSNTTASSNTAVGYQAGYSNTTGLGVVAIGYQSLYASTTANFSIAVGYEALKVSTSTGVNTAVGLQGLTSNTTGISNVAIGGGDGVSLPATLSANTTGSYNTAVGMNALAANTTASNNTAVGYQAGYANTTGADLTAIGYQALDANTTGNYSTAVGYSALGANTTGSANEAFGREALRLNTTGSNNTALGYRTLDVNTTGGNNIAVGQFALGNNTTASQNTAVGYQALYSNTTSTGNTAVGYLSLDANTTGAVNTAVGSGSGGNLTTGNFNVFVGHQAGLAVTTGSDNTFVGGGAFGVTSGSGSLVTTGSKNTILGAYNGNQGGLDIRTSNNHIVLSDGDGNPRLVIDELGNVGIGDHGYTGWPDFPLHITKNADFGVRWRRDGGTNNPLIQFDLVESDSSVNIQASGSTVGPMKFSRGATEVMRLDTGDRLLVGKDTNDFTVAGLIVRPNGDMLLTRDSGDVFTINRLGTDGTVISIRNDSSQVGTISVAGGSTSYNTSSDYRLKENVVELTGATDRLKQLNPSRFNFIADADTTVDGFLAHEVQTVVPEAITGTHNEVDADGNPVYQGIDQSKLVPLLVATIQELEARITALENA
jgi:hypothetical protein